MFENTIRWFEFCIIANIARAKKFDLQTWSLFKS